MNNNTENYVIPKLTPELREWIIDCLPMLEKLRHAEKTVGDFGSVSLHYRDGRFIGLDACPRIRDRAEEKI